MHTVQILLLLLAGMSQHGGEFVLFFLPSYSRRARFDAHFWPMEEHTFSFEVPVTSEMAIFSVLAIVRPAANCITLAD